MARKLDTLRSLLDWRQPGGFVSVAGHAAMLIVGLAAFSSAKPFTPAQEGVAVDVISEREFNEMMKGEKKGEKRPEPQPRALLRPREGRGPPNPAARAREDDDPARERALLFCAHGRPNSASIR